jgi:hypothetical protein
VAGPRWEGDCLTRAVKPISRSQMNDGYGADIVEKLEFLRRSQFRGPSEASTEYSLRVRRATGLATYDALIGVAVATTDVDNTMCAQVRFLRHLNFRVFQRYRADSGHSRSDSRRRTVRPKQSTP